MIVMREVWISLRGSIVGVLGATARLARRPKGAEEGEDTAFNPYAAEARAHLCAPLPYRSDGRRTAR